MKPSSVAWFSVFLLASGARAQSLQAPSVWFSYDKPGRQVFKSIQLELPDNSRNGFDDLTDEIVVIGERQRRHLQLVKPDEDMTGPRGLDAAQPVVPGIGAVCSYKTLCYDMSQPPLRADLVKVFFPGETPQPG